MVFSSLVFLYIFLPFVLLGLGICSKVSYQNTFLFIVSLLFYSWGGISYTMVLLASIVLNWLFGLAIEKWRDKSKMFVVFSIVTNIGILAFFKYTNFFVDNVNSIATVLHLHTLEIEKIALPIGISFYTFQGVSYVIDVYRGSVSAQKNFIKLGAYIALFPQLIAGPIIRYKELQTQLDNRRITLDNFYHGLKRFCLGLARKVLIANQLAIVADAVFSKDPALLQAPTAWIGILCYTLQIYYDFAGYSDMAIGLGRMFGFSFPENFNFPYISKSIKEFWRRWHMTLSAWFKDYLYIPLGGNRCSTKRLYFNLYVVFFCTGFWHGASWNFIVWGLFHGTFLVLERGKFGTWLNAIPPFFQHIYTLFIVMIAWIFFRAENLSYGLDFIRCMFGLNQTTESQAFMFEYLTGYKLIILAIALLSATPLLSVLHEKIQQLTSKSSFVETTYYVLIIVFIIVVVAMSTSILLTGGYNPFIYFKF